MTDLDAIRERHRPHRDEDGTFCLADSQDWGEHGCDAAQAVARVAELEAALEAISGTDVSDEGEPARPEPKPEKTEQLFPEPIDGESPFDHDTIMVRLGTDNRVYWSPVARPESKP